MTDPDGTIFRWSGTKFADPTKIAPHPPVAGIAPSTCTSCKHAYLRTPIDVVHWVEQPCIHKCGTMVPAGRYECLPCATEQAAKRRAEALARLAGADPTPIIEVEPEDPDEVDRVREGHNPLYAEAKQYAATYTGTWEFMTDMKRRVTGPKGVRGPLSDRQVEVILASKKRDEEFAATRAKAMAVRVQTGRDLTVLPVGRTYAAVDNDSGGLTFLIIDRPAPEHPRWGGFVFVKQQQGGEEVRLGMQRPGETYVGQWENLIAIVLADPIAAVKRYGEALGVCGICNRPLTNEVSRSLSIGPVCLAKLQKGLD